MEILSRFLGRKDKNLNIETAQQILLSSITQRGELIRNMRAYWQHLMAGGNSDFDQLNQIANKVKQESNGQLSCDWASLFTVNVSSNEFLAHHDLSRFVYHDYNKDTLEGILRGFTFIYEHPKTTFEVFLLDEGSRRTFDEMDNKVKEHFAKLFGERRRNTAILLEPQKAPDLYVAIVTQEDSQKYHIEKMVVTKPQSPLPSWDK